MQVSISIANADSTLEGLRSTARNSTDAMRIQCKWAIMWVMEGKFSLNEIAQQARGARQLLCDCVCRYGGLAHGAEVGAVENR